MTDRTDPHQKPTSVPQAALAEALDLSAEILRNVELSEAPLSAIALKTSRLARLVGDFSTQRMMSLEAGGYAHGSGSVPQEDFQLAVRAGRQTTGFTRDEFGTVVKWSDNLIWTESIEALEQTVAANRIVLERLQGESRPVQRGLHGVISPTERQTAQTAIKQASEGLASRRRMIYDYALRVHYELKFSGIADDVFTRTRQRVDASLGTLAPDAVKQFTSVYENLQSTNSEDWSNAAHSCRRILQAVADRLLPPQREPRVVNVGGKAKEIQMGPDQYVNRLVAFVETRSSSERFRGIVGSELRFIGERLDAAFRAAQKGSHSTVSREEADRYVVATYLIVGDILTLAQIPADPTAF